jgi:DNA-binding IclR family transcriptional regulator
VEVEETARTGSQAVERAIAVLDSFANGEAKLSLRQLAERANLPASTTYRIAQALVRGGLLERDGRDGYQAGPGLVVLARPVLSRMRLDAAAPLLYQLAARINLTVSFGVAGDVDFLTVLSARPTAHFCAHQVPGEHEPLHASALGKAVLAFGRPGSRAAVRDQARLARFTGRTHTSMTELMSDLSEVRQRGFALSDEERAEGLRAIAVPVFGLDSDAAVGAMGVQDLSPRLTDQLVGDLVPALKYFAREVGRQLRTDAIANSEPVRADSA